MAEGEKKVLTRQEKMAKANEIVAILDTIDLEESPLRELEIRDLLELVAKISLPFRNVKLIVERF
jgi:hypothetical protein